MAFLFFLPTITAQEATNTIAAASEMSAVLLNSGTAGVEEVVGEVEDVGLLEVDELAEFGITESALS